MEEKKKKTNIWFVLLITLFIIFISLYFMNGVGYYDATRNRMILTDEKKEQFEKDVSEGKYIDIEDYFKDQKKDYDNNFSNLSLKVSDSIDVVFNKGLKETIKALGKLFKEKKA